MFESAIILGAGASDGVGGALARGFANNGLHAILAARTLEKIETLATEIRDAGGSAEAVQVDVTSETDQDTLFTLAAERGPIAAVLYNAGNNAIIPFEQLDADTLESFWRVGCLGAFLTAKRAIPLLKEQGRGSLFFTGASASMRGKTKFRPLRIHESGAENARSISSARIWATRHPCCSLYH